MDYIGNATENRKGHRANAFSWLVHYLSMNPGEAEEVALLFAQRAGHDEIQDIFQSDMEADGFFASEEVCDICGERFAVGEAMYRVNDQSPCHKGCAEDDDE